MIEKEINTPSGIQRIVVLSVFVLFVSVTGFIVEFHYLKKRDFSQANIAGEMAAQNLEFSLLNNLNRNYINSTLNRLNHNDSIATACMYNASRLLDYIVPKSSTNLSDCPSQIIDTSHLNTNSLWFEINDSVSGKKLGGLLLEITTQPALHDAVVRSFLYLLSALGLGLGLYYIFIGRKGYLVSANSGSKPSLKKQFISESDASLSEKQLSSDLIKFMKEISTQLELRNNKILKESDFLKKSNRNMSSVLAHATHELRNPLHAIINFSDISLKMVKNKDSKEDDLTHCLENIRYGASKIVKLISILLDLSKIENGVLNLRVEKENLLSLIERAKSELLSSFEKKNIKIVLDTSLMPKNIDHCTIFCDSFMVNIVLGNILANALRFTPSGGEVRVVLSYEESSVELDLEEKKVEFIRVSIEDTGVGFPPNETSDIFLPFHKGSNIHFESKSPINGMGLGLSLSKEIIEAHKGTISAKNSKKGGAIVSFTLPMQAIDIDESEFNLPISSKSKHTESDLRAIGDFE